MGTLNWCAQLEAHYRGQKAVFLRGLCCCSNPMPCSTLEIVLIDFRVRGCVFQTKTWQEATVERLSINDLWVLKGLPGGSPCCLLGVTFGPLQGCTAVQAARTSPWWVTLAVVCFKRCTCVCLDVCMCACRCVGMWEQVCACMLRLEVNGRCLSLSCLLVCWTFFETGTFREPGPQHFS